MNPDSKDADPVAAAGLQQLGIPQSFIEAPPISNRKGGRAVLSYIDEKMQGGLFTGCIWVGGTRMNDKLMLVARALVYSGAQVQGGSLWSAVQLMESNPRYCGAVLLRMAGSEGLEGPLNPRERQSLGMWLLDRIEDGRGGFVVSASHLDWWDIELAQFIREQAQAWKV